MNYYYFNDFPLNLASGGKEDQLRFVVNQANKIFNKVEDLSHTSSFANRSVLHCFGDTPHFAATVKYLMGTGKNLKFVISPNFFRRKAIAYKISKIGSILGPNWWSQRNEMYKLANLIIVNSEYEKNYLNKIFGEFIVPKTKIVYNTFDLKQPNVDSTFEKSLLILSQ